MHEILLKEIFFNFKRPKYVFALSVIKIIYLFHFRLL